MRGKKNGAEMDLIIIIFFWLVLAAIVAVAADTRNRNGAGWFFFALFASPLIAGLLLIAVGPGPSHSGRLAACPNCAELIQPAAKICRFCGCEQEPGNAYPDSINGIRYRVNQDRTVEVMTPNGPPKKYWTWKEFWNAHGIVEQLNSAASADAFEQHARHAARRELGKN